MKSNTYSDVLADIEGREEPAPTDIALSILNGEIDLSTIWPEVDDE